MTLKYDNFLKFGILEFKISILHVVVDIDSIIPYAAHNLSIHQFDKVICALGKIDIDTDFFLDVVLSQCECRSSVVMRPGRLP